MLSIAAVAQRPLAAHPDKNIADAERQIAAASDGVVYGDNNANTSVYTVGAYQVSTNYVASGQNAGLVQDVDYIDRVFYKNSGFPNGSVIFQNWPARTGSQVRGYPEVKFTGTPLKISGLESFIVDYDVSIAGDTGCYDVALDVWLRSDTNPTSTPVKELFIALWAPTGWGFTSNQAFNLDSISPCHGSGIYYETRTIPIISCMLSPMGDGGALKSSLDLKAVLSILKANGIISGNEYVDSVELGVEARQLYSVVTINKFAVTLV